MRVAIVSPVTIPEPAGDASREHRLRDLAEHIPVGALTLVSILDAHGVDVAFVDMNDLYAELACEGPPAGVAEAAARRIAALDADLVGFGTLCSSYPLTLRIASALARHRPGRRIVLGGPQASATAEATLAAFPAVDFVLEGEADASLVSLVRGLAGDRELADVAGLVYRRHGLIRRGAAPRAPEDLDAIPLPSYQRLAAVAAMTTLPLEVGRGCPYGCAFCSTNVFFRRRFRLKSPRTVVAQMTELAGRFGVRDFDFVHDMLTVVRDDVVALCEALIAAGAPFGWHCSARTDRVDAELLDLMAAAGCRGIFFGIESGSARQQRLLKKRLDLTEARARVAEAAARDLRVVVSLITGFPDEQPDDLRDTVGFFVESLRHPRTTPQLHLLSPLPGSPLFAAYRDRLVFDDILSDISHNGSAQDADDRRLIAAHRDVFASFYAVPTPLDRPFLKQLRQFLVEATIETRWLLLALHRGRHALDLAAELCAWAAALPDRAAPFELPRGAGFRALFLRFARERFAGSHAIDTLIAIAEATGRAKAGSPPAPPSAGPRPAPGVAFTPVTAPLEPLTAALVAGADLAAVPRIAAGVAVRATGDDVTIHFLPPLMARVALGCDGSTGLGELADQIAGDALGLGVAPAQLVALAVEQLRAAQLVDPGELDRALRARGDLDPAAGAVT